VQGGSSLRQDQVIASIALVVVAAYAAFTVVTRFHEGRCRLGGGGYRMGFSCAYPPATAPTTP